MSTTIINWTKKELDDLLDILSHYEELNEEYGEYSSMDTNSKTRQHITNKLKKELKKVST